jgi:membrane protein insertase Oxa1/YidC/SpoIIIJ
MSQFQFEQQSFTDLQQQVKELRQKYTNELQKIQSETRLLVSEQQRKTDVLCSRFSFDTKQITSSLYHLQKLLEANLSDS